MLPMPAIVICTDDSIVHKNVSLHLFPQQSFEELQSLLQWPAFDPSLLSLSAYLTSTDRGIVSASDNVSPPTFAQCSLEEPQSLQSLRLGLRLEPEVGLEVGIGVGLRVKLGAELRVGFGVRLGSGLIVGFGVGLGNELGVGLVGGRGVEHEVRLDVGL